MGQVGPGQVRIQPTGQGRAGPNQSLGALGRTYFSGMATGRAGPVR